MAPQPKIIITNVRIFDGHSFQDPTSIVVENGLIGSDAHGAEEVDGRGGFLLPGFIDAHIHLQDEKDLQQLAKYGVTTGLDMATWPPSKLEAVRGREGLTDIRSPGLPATCQGSVHSQLLPIPKDSLVAGPQDAADFVESRVSEGADYIKIIADVPGPDQPTLNALVTASHERNLLVVAHASSYTPYRMAQEAKSDVITHAPCDKTLDAEVINQMVSGKQIAVPTLTMMEGRVKSPGLGAVFRLLLRPSVFLAVLQANRKDPHGQGKKYEFARDSVTMLYHAGVPILAGTDANSEPGSPFKVMHGESLHHELELLVDAGLSTIDTLRAATSLPAKHFNLRDRGVIEAGKRADLVLLSEDPLKNIRATRSIQRVWCGGIEFRGSESY